mgnify:CR=1 FL=1
MTPTDLMSQCKRILNLDLNSKELGCLVVQMLEDDEANENAKRSKNSNAMLSTAALAANVEKELLGAEATEVAEDPEKVNEEAEDDNGLDDSEAKRSIGGHDYHRDCGGITGVWKLPVHHPL